MTLRLTDDGLSYDDVLLKPRYSNVFSRDEVDLTATLAGGYTIRIPLISANMDTVTEVDMANAMADIGGVGFIHRFLSIGDQRDALAHTRGPRVAVIGVKDYAERLKHLEGCFELILVDVAHGHHQRVIDLMNWCQKNYPSNPVIAGNVATYEGAHELMSKGASSVKVGVGPGAACTTRIVTGCGIPQLTAVMEAARAREDYFHQTGRYVSVIADGGIKTSGHIVKALAAGADTVMIGNLFSGTDEAPGDIIEKDGELFKTYRGMASLEAQARIDKTRAPEGISTLSPYRGSVKNIVATLLDGIRSGLSYCNARTIREFHLADIEMVKISGAGLRESHPHALWLR